MKYTSIVTMSLLLVLSACGSNDAPEPPKPKTEKPADPHKQNKDKEKEKENNNQPQGEEKPRPSDLDLGRRAQAQWNVEKEKYSAEPAFEVFFLQNKGDNAAIERLKTYLRFSSSATDGTPYAFTEEEIKEIQLAEVTYDESTQYIRFKTTFRGYTSQDFIQLSLKKADFYEQLIKENTDYITQHYMRGVAHYFEAMVGEVLQYDTDKYAVTIQSKEGNDYNNQITCTLRVTHKTSGKELITLQKTLKGFKTLDKLAEDLQASPKHELVEYIKKAQQNDIETYLKTKTDVWKHYVQFTARQHYTLGWDKSSSTLLPESNNDNQVRDIFLQRVGISLLSATYKGDDLHLKISLDKANDQVVQGATFEFVVRGTK